MAASGIHRYLKDPGASWSDKLKVARYAWVTESCYIPNKYQVLLNWGCDALAHGDFSHEDGDKQLTGQWTYLREILQSKAFRQESLTIPGFFYNALHKALLDKRKHHSEVLQVTQELFSQPQLCGKLLAKSDSSIDILASLLRLLRDDVSDGSPSCLLSITEHALQVFAEKYKFRVINRKMFEDVTQKVLLSCLCLHREMESPDLKRGIERFLAETLLSEDLLPRYEDFLYPKKGFESATSVQKMVESVSSTLDMMGKVLDSPTVSREIEGVLSGIPLLYRLFITSLRPRPEMCFQMLKKYLEVLGFSESRESWEGSECQRSLVMDSVHSLLTEVRHHDVYSVLDDAAAGGKSKAFLKHLAGQVITLNQWNQPSWYSSLQSLFALDYNLVTKHQSMIMRAAISEPSSSEEGSTEKLQDAKLILLTKVSDTYLRMRQFPTFCTFLMKGCGLQDSGYSSIQLSPEFLTQFGAMVQTLPLQMSLGIWSTLKASVAEMIPETTHNLWSSPQEGISEPPPPKKKRKKKRTSDLPDHGSSNRLESLAVLLGAFVRNCKVVEFSGLSHGAKRVRALLQEMVSEVLLPSLETIAGLDDSKVKELEPFVFTVLFVACCHGDLRLLLFNFVGDPDIVGEEHGENLKSGNVHLLHSYIGKDVWTKVFAACELLGRGRVKYLLDTLVLQQVKLLMLLPDRTSPDTDSSLANLVPSLCPSLDHPGSLGVWNGLPCTIAGGNYLTAQFQQLVQHYPMLGPHMSDVNRGDFVVLLCRALFSPRGPSAKDGGTTGRSIAVDFIQSDVCTESRDLHNLLVGGAIEQLSAVMAGETSGSSEPDSGGEAAAHLDLSGVLRDPTGLHRYIKQIRSAAPSTDSHTQHHAMFVKVLSAVPIKLLSVENQTSCLLALHVVDFHLSRCEGAPTQNQLQLLAHVRRLATEFIRVVPGSDLLGQVNVKALIIELVTSHLEFSEKVVKDQSSESLLSQLEASRHSSELFSHWLRREGVWASGTSHCVKSLMKKLKTQLEAHMDDTLNHVALVDLAAVVLKHLAKHSGSIPSSLHEYSSSLYRFQEALSDQMDSASHNLPCTVFAASTMSTFFLHANDIRLDRGDDLAKDPSVQSILSSLKQSWIAKLLLWLPEWPPANQEKGMSRLISSASEPGLKLVRMTARGADGEETSWRCLYRLLGRGDPSAELTETVRSIIPGMDDSQFQELLASSVSSIRGGSNDIIDCLAGVRLWQHIPYSELTAERVRTISAIVLRLIEHLTSLIQEINLVMGSELVSSVMESIAFVLNRGKELLDEETAVSSLSLCVLVRLDDLSPESFPSVFQAVCRVPNNLMQSFPRSVQKSSHSYIACLQHLLRGVMERGQQISVDSIPDDQLVLCAEAMERYEDYFSFPQLRSMTKLLSCFASFKETKQVACFLVATFFQELQEGTLLPAVKKILVLGMYHLVGSADFKSLDSVQSMMPDGLREIYKSFIEDFHKYHRFKGNV